MISARWSQPGDLSPGGAVERGQRLGAREGGSVRFSEAKKRVGTQAPKTHSVKKGLESGDLS